MQREVWKRRLAAILLTLHFAMSGVISVTSGDGREARDAAKHYLPCTGQPPTSKDYTAQTAIVQRLRTPDMEEKKPPNKTKRKPTVWENSGQ